MATIVFLGVGGVAALAYFAGLFDRPNFERHDKIQLAGEAKPDTMYVLLAVSTEKNFGQQIPRMLQDSAKAIDTLTDAAKMQEMAATMYGAAPCEKLSVGLYFDNPSTTDKPRWGIGWMIVAESFKKAQAMAEEANATKLLKEEIIAVHFPSGPVLTGRFFWRHMLTPMIAPMIHWPAAFKIVTEKGYDKQDRPDTNCSGGVIACEVYVMNEKQGGKSFIDYHALLRDANLWYEAFPNAK